MVTTLVPKSAFCPILPIVRSESSLETAGPKDQPLFVQKQLTIVMAQALLGGRKPRVVALGTPKFVGDDYLAEFKKDFDYQVLDVKNHQETLEQLPAMIEKHGPIDAFIIRMGRGPYHPFNEAMFKPLTPHCRIIASAAAGYDDFDIEWLTQNNIWFCNSLDAVAEATADMSFFLTLAVVRDTSRAERCAREGLWKDPVVPSKDPSGMTLGIVGMGAIGKHLAKRADAFNMRIKYYNRRQLSADDEARYNATYCTSLHELLGQSDVVSINCPLNAETKNLISTREFSAMKDGSFIVNTSRGAVVDEPALIAALESGKVARAGLDVFWNEPDIDSYFKTSDKVTIQPHVGGLTDLAFQKGERECFENIKALFKTGRPIAPVNEIS
ncbi:D-isomer specific 2-hydroxyacid dehydrogenase [Dactylonectria macrodidyma]|uniref:D-isomer specific 2-hydroxyacid dehydrogenase n=1 Tax=Dactylonectria macrodidyma TaxID=307937 RepID=A0A9P9DYS0_9HYPO|nr:D-isomer specific 2-hydroxyacid dehydrogenase [Dactylonectria macrodidyma]